MTHDSTGLRLLDGIIKTAPKSACNTRQGLTRSSGTSREGLPAMVPRTCTIAQCENKYFSRGMCQKHYSRVRRSGTTETIPMDPMSIFLRHTEKTDGCWLWNGYRSPEGRGVVNFTSGKVFAYRLGYELLVGPIPEGLTLDHLCVNPRCVNPAHMEPVPAGVNSLRGSGPAAQNKRKTHCHKGHPLSGDNLYNKPGGSRQCRRCINERARLRRAATKAQATKETA